MSDELLGAAWSLLREADVSLPEELLLVTPKHHAILAFLCHVRLSGCSVQSVGEGLASGHSMQLVVMRDADLAQSVQLLLPC